MNWIYMLQKGSNGLYEQSGEFSAIMNAGNYSNCWITTTCVESEVLTEAVAMSSILRDITPCIPLKVNRRFGRTCRIYLQGRRKKPEWKQVTSRTLKMEVKCSCETLVEFQQTTRRYIPDDKTLHNHRCEKLKSYVVVGRSAIKS
jgi:hypothetical protein